MKQFDFDTPVDRRHSGSLKWDVAENELPMWVADMDFRTAPEICEALLRRAEHGIFGYTVIGDDWYDAYTHWWESRHGFHMERDWLIFCTGVVPAISSMVRKLTTPAEKVLFLTPVYNIFYNSVLNNGRQVLECPLAYGDGGYTVDFNALEAGLADPQTTLMILCNPHNPIGKLWDRDTLARIGTLCHRHGVTVISDEIHCDLTAPGQEYVPFASVSEECRQISVTCMAPTKAFNIAGIQTAAVAVSDPFLRHRVWRGLNTDEVAEPNAFAVAAAVAAFEHGAPWLDALRQYVEQNKHLTAAFCREHVPSIRVVPSEATYLLWLDCGAEQNTDAAEIAAFLRRHTGLYLSAGAQYGGNGRSFLRMNVACPRSVLEDGLHRLEAGMREYFREKKPEFAQS